MRRIAVRARALLRLVVSIAVYSVGSAVLFFIGMLLNLFLDVLDRPLSSLLYMGALFSVFGALYGTIAALDESSDFRIKVRPLIRTFELPKLRAGIGAGWGLLAVFLATHLADRTATTTSLVVGAAVGGVLGWFGWRWAKHVDF
jgi:hypothetical protein